MSSNPVASKSNLRSLYGSISSFEQRLKQENEEILDDVATKTHSESYEKIQTTLKMLRQDWNEMVCDPFQPLEISLSLMPNNPQKSLESFLETQKEVEEMSNIVVEDIVGNFASIASTITYAKNALNFNFGDFIEAINASEEKKKALEVLTQFKTIIQSLDTVETNLASGELLNVPAIIVKIETSLAIVDTTPSLKVLPQFVDSKFRLERARKQFETALLSKLIVVFSNPLATSDANNLLLEIFATPRFGFEDVLYEFFGVFKESVRSWTSKEVATFERQNTLVSCDLQAHVLQREDDCFISVVAGSNAEKVGCLFRHVLSFMNGILRLFDRYLSLLQFKANTHSFSLKDVFDVLAREIKMLMSCFLLFDQVETKKDTYDELFEDAIPAAFGDIDFATFKLDVPVALADGTNLLKLPTFVKLLNTKISDECNGAESPSTASASSDSSLQVMCARIAPKSLYYSRIYDLVCEFMKAITEDSLLTAADIFELSETVKGLWSDSFCKSLENSLVSFARNQLSRIESFEAVIVDKNVQIFQLIPSIIANLKGIASLWKATTSVAFISEDKLVAMFEIFCGLLLNKLKSLYVYIFSENAASGSQLCASAAILETFLASESIFMLNLDSEQASDIFYKKEILMILAFKKERSFRKEECVLDANKIEKALLLYRSLVYLQSALRDIERDIKAHYENTAFFGRLQKIIQQDVAPFIPKIFYTLRLEVRIQCVYFMELAIFDTNPDIQTYAVSVGTTITTFDAVICRVVNIEAADFIMRGLSQSLKELIETACKTQPVMRHSFKSRLIKIIAVIEHSLFNLTSCKDPQDFVLFSENILKSLQ